MKAMRTEMAFFDGDDLLARAMVLIHAGEETCTIESERGDQFHVTRQFEEPASRVFIKCYSEAGESVGQSAMRMGVHNSQDWEMVELAPPYQLCFKCAIVDCDNPNWATQAPLPDDA